jgi:carboxylate-amine ligase
MTKQIFPSTITGASFAEGGSVLEHRFGEGDAYTLGVEEEYMLLDGQTFDLVQHVETVLAAAEGDELAERVNPELMQSVLEIATPVCSSPAEIDLELRKLRAYVTGLARERELRVGSAGTHPFSLFERQRITARDRYRHLVDQLQYVARRELIFGLHIHVAVDDAEKAIKVVNGLLAHLSSLLALSASSPFWRGEPTGLASSRQMVFAAFPRSGPPPRFNDYADYAEVVGQLEKTGCIADYTHIWWDIRLHPRGVVPVAGEALFGALRRRQGDPLVPPDPDHGEQMARRPLRARGARDGSRGGPQESSARGAADPANAEGDRAACT